MWLPAAPVRVETLGAPFAAGAGLFSFAVDYADQNQRDYRAFVRAVREERVEAVVES